MRSREREAEGRREGERQRDGKSDSSEETRSYVSFMLNHGLYTFDRFTCAARTLEYREHAPTTVVSRCNSLMGLL